MSGLIKIPRSTEDHNANPDPRALPPGVYHVRVDRFYQKASGILVAKFTVIEGNERRKEVWEPFDLQHARALKRFYAFLGAIGTGTDVTELDPAQCIGRNLKVTVAERNGWLSVVKHEAAPGTCDAVPANGDGSRQC